MTMSTSFCRSSPDAVDRVTIAPNGGM